jgi:hypothetical protein
MPPGRSVVDNAGQSDEGTSSLSNAELSLSTRDRFCLDAEMSNGQS